MKGKGVYRKIVSSSTVPGYDFNFQLEPKANLFGTVQRDKHRISVKVPASLHYKSLLYNYMFVIYTETEY